MKSLNKIVIVLIFVICLYSVFLIFSDVNLIYDKLSKFKVEFLPIVLTLIVFGWLILFLRWHLLLRNSKIYVPAKSSFFIFLSGFAFGLIPGEMGDLVKAQILKDRFDIPRIKTSAIIISEWFYTASGLVSLSLIGVFVFEFGIYVGIIFGSLLILFWFLINSKKLFLKFITIISKIKFISHLTKPIPDSLDIIKNSTRGKIAIISILLSISFWLVESITVYFIFRALDITEIEFIKIIPMYSSAIILGYVSFLPLGTGVVEGIFAGFLKYQGIDISIALAGIIAIRLFTRWFPIIIGFMSLKKWTRLKI